MKLVLIHGWGLDANVWDDLAAKLGEYPMARIDLGFFSEDPVDVGAAVAAAVPDNEPAILIGHSLGFVEGVRLKRRWAGWVAINSFARFVAADGKSGCVSAGVLREMQRRLAMDVRGTLDGFYKMIDADSTVGVPNAGRLQAGLDMLRDCDLTAKLMVDAPVKPEDMVPGLVLASRNDPLVPMDASETLALAAGSGMMWHNTAGHLLPLRDADWCAARIREFVDRVAPVTQAPEVLVREIVHRFDKAADSYAQSARMQAQVAQQIVRNAVVNNDTGRPLRILDMGCGTGFVALEAAQRWPDAHITAVDPARAMLAAVKERLPLVETIQGDAESYHPAQPFDVIFSSMMLHWLPDPVAAMQRWQGWLKPGGKIFAAFLGQESFQEWQALCEKEGMQDGLWPMPSIDMMADIADEGRIENLKISYASAGEFLRGLKKTGAAMPRSGYRQLSAPALRWLLKSAPQPFPVTYQIISLSLPALAA